MITSLNPVCAVNLLPEAPRSLWVRTTHVLLITQLESSGVYGEYKAFSSQWHLGEGYKGKTCCTTQNPQVPYKDMASYCQEPLC